MPTAATSQNGPQAVAPYNYPRGEDDGSGKEWIYRRGWVTDDDPTPGVLHTLEVTDGQGGLPIENQPETIQFRYAGIVQYHTHFWLQFQRRIGHTGPYKGLPPVLELPPGPGQPHTMAQ